MKRYVSLFLVVALMLGISGCRAPIRGQATNGNAEGNYTNNGYTTNDTHEPQTALLLEEVVEGSWLAELDYSPAVNAMLDRRMGEINERLDEDRPYLNLSDVSNLKVAFSFSFRQGKADMRFHISKDFEATLFNAWKGDLGQWIDMYYAQKGITLTDSMREAEIADAMQDVLEIIEMEPHLMEDGGEPIMTNEMYAILGNVLYIDDEQIGTLTVVNENVLTMEVYVGDEGSSMIESTGFNTTWTLKRISDEELNAGKTVGNVNNSMAQQTGLERWYRVQNAQQDAPYGIARFTIKSEGIIQVEVISRGQDTGKFYYNITECTAAESENGIGFSFQGTWLIQGNTVLYQQWIWNNGKKPQGNFYTPPSNEESVSWYGDAMRYYSSILQ